MRVVRYSEQPDLWESLDDLSSQVWPEYNLHGDVLNPYWDRLYEERGLGAQRLAHPHGRPWTQAHRRSVTVVIGACDTTRANAATAGG